MNRLEEFAAPEIVSGAQEKYTWVIEYRHTDSAGTPFQEEWDCYSAVAANNPFRVKYPERNKQVAAMIEDLKSGSAGGFEEGNGIEYRIRLERRIERSEGVAATEPCLLL